MDDLVGVYTEVYAEPPYNSGPLWSAEAFATRTRRQAFREGFSFVAATNGEDVVGFAFGLKFQAGQWWSGNATKPPPAVLGVDKFAVIELVVRRQSRGLGLGRRLMH